MHLSVKIRVKSLPWPMDLLSMLGPGWEFPQERGFGKKWNMHVIFFRFWYIIGVNICETHERRKTINTKKPVRSQPARAKENVIYIFCTPFYFVPSNNLAKLHRFFHRG